MTDPTALAKLADEIERADGPSREIDRKIWYSLQNQMIGDPAHSPKFTASIDAALTLVPYDATIDLTIEPGGASEASVTYDVYVAVATGATPALALCAQGGEVSEVIWPPEWSKPQE